MTPEKIKLLNGKLIVPENPVIPYIEEMVPDLISGKHRYVFLMLRSVKFITGRKK
jgi:hypothetical protein